MRFWFVGSVAFSVVALVFTRYLSSPSWIIALFILCSSLGLNVALALALILQKWQRRRWLSEAALSLGLGAALCRTFLLKQLLVSPEAIVSIQFWRITCACSSVVWGALALIWGTLAVSDSLGLHEEKGLKRAILHWPFLAASLAVILSLYSIAPLGAFFKIRITPLSLLGLFVLACVAFGIGKAYRAVKPRRQSVKRNK